MGLSNKWFGYFDRSYEQTMASIKSNMDIEVPEITDKSESNLFIKISSIFCGLFEQLGYYVDNWGRESFLQTCRLYSSATKHAFANDYRIKMSRAASVDLTFKLVPAATSNFNIPAGTIVKTANGKEFRTTIISNWSTGDSSKIITAEQIDSKITSVSLGSTTGDARGQYLLPEKNITDNSVSIIVNGDLYLLKETLAYSINTDKHFIQTINTEGIPIIYFGDNINGINPPAGQTIIVSYNTCSASNGNITAYSINQLVSVLVLPVGCTLYINNTSASSGGGGIETLAELKNRIPKRARTLLRAVSKQDYSDIAVLYGGVASSYLSFKCGSIITLYVAPIGGGIASTFLINNLYTWFQDKISFPLFINSGTGLQIVPAGEIFIAITIKLKIKDVYTQFEGADQVTANLVDFLSYKNQKIFGTVEEGNLYEIIENTEQVEVSEIVSIIATPYARPIAINVLVLSAEIIPKIEALVVSYWKILITSAGTYQLYKDGNFIGNYNINTQYTFIEIYLTVYVGGYIIGDGWEFIVYPIAKSIKLLEPSIPVSDINNIIITATGGIL